MRPRFVSSRFWLCFKFGSSGWRHLRLSHTAARAECPIAPARRRDHAGCLKTRSDSDPGPGLGEHSIPSLD